ncbi:hypothetical protein Har1130_18085 [Haloarcula sp. CBA1130]|uniref:hypothetical protein n=1 Tax=unclassified Haloarcula TaxID=2624677 RepID=UPI0012477E38|nr:MULTISPECIES: hypothetical protein [unclassified Haloarcula]KAA9396559.1 hypothetical protein Har1130_18085 [Haloarcula sp. CBA1130]KAA9397582.1 hypothetical protein Har1129_04715 [Haloarcula sp. CBA1129]
MLVLGRGFDTALSVETRSNNLPMSSLGLSGRISSGYTPLRRWPSVADTITIQPAGVEQSAALAQRWLLENNLDSLGGHHIL